MLQTVMLKDVHLFFQHTFQFQQINKSTKLKQGVGVAFSNIHTEQVKNLLKILKIKNFEKYAMIQIFHTFICSIQKPNITACKCFSGFTLNRQNKGTKRKCSLQEFLVTIMN